MNCERVRAIENRMSEREKQIVVLRARLDSDLRVQIATLVADQAADKNELKFWQDWRDFEPGRENRPPGNLQCNCGRPATRRGA
jgi:hypothetical protein